MKEVLKKLSNLADRLDSRGHYKLADNVDNIIKKYSSDNKDDLSKFKNLGEKEVEVPKEELDYLKEVFKDLDSSLEEEEEAD